MEKSRIKMIKRGVLEIIQKTSELAIPWEDQSILISGGAGFLGSWLTDVFVEKESDVMVVDNLSSGLIDNIDHLLEKDNFQFDNHDITDFKVYKKKFDYVFHLASRASPFEFEKYPIEILKANTLGVLNALEISKENNAKFLFTSTSEIYGNPERKYIPTPESYNGNVNPTGPRGCYDESKRAGEAFSIAFFSQFNLDVRITRIFNTFGPRMRDGNLYGRVIPNFVSQCINDKPITVFGDGTQTRSFSYVTDTIEGILRAAYSLNTKGEVFNIGNANEISINALAKVILELNKKNNPIEYFPLPIDDPKFRCPELSKALNFLGFKTSKDLKDGLSDFIQWYKDGCD